MNYVWGLGTHSNKQAGVIMPEMLRWLWRDYPRNDNPQDAGNRSFFVPAGAANPPAATPPR